MVPQTVPMLVLTMGSVKKVPVAATLVTLVTTAPNASVLTTVLTTVCVRTSPATATPVSPASTVDF